jgi:outer membrane lipoprotein-sorting protein
MSQSKPNPQFIAILSAALVLLALFAAACSKSEQPATNSAAAPASAASSSAGDFEGMIAMKMETENQTNAEMTYFLKGKHTRIETKFGNLPEGSAVMLWDLDAGKITTLMPSRKMYMTMDMNAAAENMKQMKKSQGQEEAEFPKLTPTGKQETIAGYTCEHWLMGENQDVDLCVAKGLGYFGMGGQSAGGLASLKNLAFSPKMLAAAAAHPEWVKFLNGGAFPLKLSAMRDGKVTMTMEATRIDKKPLDDSLFVIPTDYKEFSMPNMPAPPARQ